MIVIYDSLDQRLAELDTDIDEAFHAECLRRLRAGDERRHGLPLYGLVRAFKPHCIVDVGTAWGYTAVIGARALEDAKVEGRVYTIDLIAMRRARTGTLQSSRRRTRLEGDGCRGGSCWRRSPSWSGGASSLSPADRAR